MSSKSGVGGGGNGTKEQSTTSRVAQFANAA